MNDYDDNYMSIEDLEAHEKFMEEVRTAEPTRSCDMVRAWMKLNIQSVFTDVWKN
jgi:hypothetical protein